MAHPIYLDYQATTPTDPRVVETMLPYFTEKFGNAAAGHGFGMEADHALHRARTQIASVIGADANDVLFTSGATESNNLAIRGLAAFERVEGRDRRHIVTIATEHKSVLLPCKALGDEGYKLTVLPVGRDGLVDISALEAALTDDTFLVSVMAANNEIGVIQDIARIGALCRGRGIWFHTDAAQAYGKIALDVQAMQIDLLSLSGHKVYGPQGIGALYLRHRPRVRLLPQQLGGDQERGLRAGTVPLPLAVGLGKAAVLAALEMAAEQLRLKQFSQLFLRSIRHAGVEVVVNGHAEQRLAGNLNLCFPHIHDADFTARVFERLAVASGAACNSAAAEPSHVLKAIGLEDAQARASLRISFGRMTTEADVASAAEELAACARVFQTPSATQIRA